MNRLVMATRNPGKVAELKSVLEGAGFEVSSLLELAPDLRIEEDAETFEGNAQKKALVASEVCGCPALADDSGLEVDALGGGPGVRSARFGGDGLDDAQRCQHLLRVLSDVRDEERTARFRCVLALRVPGESIHCLFGSLEGHIARELTGDHGFGYDPIFIPEGHTQSLAVLGKDIKQRISHRAQALSRLSLYLSDRSI